MAKNLRKAEIRLISTKACPIDQRRRERSRSKPTPGLEEEKAIDLIVSGMLK
jgi:hypothetical protein